MSSAAAKITDLAPCHGSGQNGYQKENDGEKGFLVQHFSSFRVEEEERMMRVEHSKFR